MNKRNFYISIFLLIFPALFSFTEEKASEKLSLQNAINLALQNNYDIQKQRYALKTAEAQYNQVKGNLDIEAGAQAQYSLKQNPVDDEDPNYTVNISGIEIATTDNSLSRQVAGSLYLKKLFSFGLETKLSYTVQGIKNTPEYKYRSSYLDHGGTKFDEEKFRNNGEISLELSLPLFKSFKDSITSLQIDAAKDYIAQMEFSLKDTISQTLITVSEKYWNYLLASKNVAQLEKMQKQIEERNENMDSLIRAGVRSKNDLLAMQVNVNENRRSLQNAKVQYNQAKMELMTVLGISDSSVIGEPEDSFSEIALQSIIIPKSEDMTEIFFAQIEENRTDLKTLKKRVDMAKKNVRLSEIDRRPDANLNFGIGAGGATYSDDLSETLSSGFSNVKGVNINGAVSVSAKLGNNTKKGNAQQALAEYETVLADYNKAKNTLTLQIKNAVEKLEIFKNLVSDADTVFSLQKNLYENERKRFNAGLITVDSLLTQDQNYISAELSYYQVLINYLQAILEYKYYTGQLVE